MKKFWNVLFICCTISLAYAQPNPKTKKGSQIQTVEASCGQCQFKMPGKGCDLAVRIKGKSYFLDGTKIDDHGDAHAKDGFCEKVRKAEIRGTIVNNRFLASYFKLIPEPRRSN